MHIEDSPLERTPDLIAKIRALREQAEKQMNQFTRADDYDIRRVTGRKPQPDSAPTPPPAPPKGKRGKNTEQASIEFTPVPAEESAADGEEA